ncbi:PREDICTED: uncharacterized protein LOC104710796 [Camelina sativa]|uniref:Uncharacterized protein LOC104710796 n=1 Tax=Camelina sativa TaxID=90675 RepID=A0ABM0TFR3_CAMSA|nr:PREDICTED: uncharacterized protein LOC104710796 [Camelina sativa]XP_010425753.1 PREDICTED: uncharacterized protein LOC104710796 [Camelina sativa]
MMMLFKLLSIVLLFGSTGCPLLSLYLVTGSSSWHLSLQMFQTSFMMLHFLIQIGALYPYLPLGSVMDLIGLFIRMWCTLSRMILLMFLWPIYTNDSVEGQVASVDIKLPRRSLQVEFTCNLCGERTKRLINRHAHERGLVFVQCAGCLQYHKLFDNLGVIVEYDFRETSKDLGTEQV